MMVDNKAKNISAAQYAFSVACFLQASSLLSSIFLPVTKQDSWFVICIGIVLCLPIIAVFIKLIQDYPGMDLFEIHDMVYGRIAGKIISATYLIFFITLTTLNLRDLGDFVKQTIMVETPEVAITIVFVIVSAWAVRNGLRVVTMYSPLFVFIALVILVGSTILAISLMKIEHFLPFLSLPLKEYVHGANIVMTIPLGEIIVFLMITPNVVKPEGKIKKYMFGGFFIGAATLLLVVLRDTAILGNAMSLFALPSFEALRMIRVSQTISRMEILFAVILIILLFFKITFLLYITARASARLFKLKSFRPLVLLTGALAVTYASFIFTSSVEHAAAGREIVTILWLPFEFIVPSLTLALAKIRKLRDKSEGG